MGIPSDFYQTLLFEEENGKVGRARGCQQIARACNMIKVDKAQKQKHRREGE